MKRLDFLSTLLLGSGGLILPNGVVAQTADALPNVLLLGDSISLGYTGVVIEELKGRVKEYRPLNAKGGYINCQGTTNAMKHLDQWLEIAPKWDVIHFNFGLHDLKHVDPVTGKNSKKEDDPQQADLKAYERNLKAIVKKLEATGAQLIFATTTSYPDRPGGPLRRADQPEKYNKTALKIMKKYGVKINDLDALTKPRLAELQPPNNVHFTKEGSAILGKQVAQRIV
ncbi:MAG: SGNH/GDSL hydrolase family protein, partial [Bacteroidota bacterium]